MIAFHVGAQEPQADPEPVVLAIFDMEPGTNNPGLDVLFLDSLGIELGLHGLRLSDSGTPTILVRISYTVDETTIRYYLSAELVADGSILFSHSYREALSFQLDSILLGQAGQLARLLQQYVEENMTAIKVDMQGNDGKPAEDGAPAGQSGNGQAAERAVNANKPLVRQSTARVAGKDSSVGGPGLAIDAGIGFFLALGEPARYFKHGYIFETFVGYRFVTPASTILGFSFDVMYFIVDGYATDAQGLVASFGPALRLKPESAGRLIPGFKINLGAALFMISLAGDETRMKVIPCADTAMTMDLLLGRSAMKMSLGVKLMYENENILYGFTPGFGFAF